MNPTPQDLGAATAPAIAAMCARSLHDPPDERAVTEMLFPEGTVEGDGPPVVFGDPERGVAAVVHRRGRWYVRLVVVDQAARGEGYGKTLLEHALEVTEGTLAIGADAPDYLYPGVHTAEVEMLTLAERLRFRREETNLNLRVDLTSLPPRPDGALAIPAGAGDADELGAWLGEHWPNWVDEGMRGLAKGNVVLARDDRGIAGFAAWNVNRVGWFGPTGVRPDERGRGTGRPLLIEAMHRLRDDGLPSAQIAWIGPIGFYAKTVGARVGNAYVVCRHHRRPPGPGPAASE